MEKKYYLLCYTREPLEDSIYSEKLAYSMHLALSGDGEHFTALNHNSGILYAKAVSRPDGTLHAKSLAEPKLFMRADGSFGVTAKRIEVDGSMDEELREQVLAFCSKDLIHYQELGAWGAGEAAETLLHEMGTAMRGAMVLLHEMGESVDGRTQRLFIGQFTQEERDAIRVQLPGAVPGNMIEISGEAAERLKCRFLTPDNTANEVPETVKAHSRKELDAVRATARYSDGSSLQKRVDWYADAVEWDKPGEYEVYGKVHQEHFPFPIAWDRADPCIGRWNGKYYFIATNDADGNNSLYIREADTIPALVTAQEIKILDSQMYPHLKGLLWAPEFHIIKDRLYIFHAGTPGPFEKEQSHVMALKLGGNPMRAQDWEMPVRVEKQDGSMLYGEQGIT
ncbi:MAG: glycosyl hydrolase, partial [Lachnospiraceae bacterium]|nr:glycosyl hydrolase [Lachnospiraceae bacterium]